MFLRLMRYGGGRIKRKLFLSLLLLFGILLILGVNTVSAQTVGCDNLPKVTASDGSHSPVVLNGSKVNVKFNKKIKIGSGYVEIKNSRGQSIQSSKTASGNILTLKPSRSLIRGCSYIITLHQGSVKDSAGQGIQCCNVKFTVPTLTLAQMKDGISRVEHFYYQNKRLPNYVNYPSKKIPINQFQKMIAVQGLKINTSNPTSSVNSASKSQSRCSAYDITITTVKVSSTAKCSCGSCGDYVYHTGSYKNYCPHCKKYDVLKWNPKGVLEGEWTCGNCGADYCAACGKEKSYCNSRHLIKI